MTKLISLNCDKTHKLICDKTKNSDCDKTQIDIKFNNPQKNLAKYFGNKNLFPLLPIRCF